MTVWIDEVAEQRRQASNRRTLIAQGATTVYETLWQEIANLVSEAAGKGVPVYVNAHDYSRDAGYPAQIKQGSFDREVVLTRSSSSSSRPAVLHVKLRKDKPETVIEISGVDHPALEFDIVGGKVGLKNSDIPSAAEAILRPFFSRMD